MTRIVSALLAAIVACVLAGAALAAPPSPPTAPGWPTSLPAGTVLQGPSGGLVLVAARPSRGGFSARAFARDGRRLWAVAQEAGCGNCDEGPQPVIVQPDGTYGPIGYDGDYVWAVDARGRLARACGGAMSPDGSCVTGSSLFAPPPAAGDSPALFGRAAGVGGETWRLVVPGYTWQDEFNVPAMTVRDDGGVVYVAFRSPARVGPAGGGVVPGILVAADPVARAILWVVEGPWQALTGLGSGVLVSDDEGIAAYRPDGTVAWRRPLPAGQQAVPRSVAYDAARGRLYLGRLPFAHFADPASQAGVTALVAHTGVQAWRTRPGDRARLLSVGRGGRVYLAVDRPGRTAVRAVRLRDGAAVWERRTGLPVEGVRELANGTVAVSAGGPFATPGRLTLLDPR